MNNNNNQLPSNMDGLLNAVSKKLGIPAPLLRKQLESGQFDQAIKGMSKESMSQFQSIASNPQLLEKFMTTPQVQALYQKLSGKK